MKHYEVNFDGLIGPTHNYSGLALGNLASAKNAKNTYKPRLAALQGLGKMRTMIELGYQQGFLLPNARPDLDVLRRLGFSGSDDQVITQTAKQAPQLLSMVYSASSMWAANAATVTPSLDASDGRVHFTPANLLTTAHRAIEHPQTQRILEAIFNSEDHFSVHPAVYSQDRFADEGAANHTRLGNTYDAAGVGLFVYGRTEQSTTRRFPARQTLDASTAVARSHGVKEAIFLQQSPVAIDGGAFHNDVVAVGNGPVLFYHEDAFEGRSQASAFAELSQRMDFQPICVPRSEVSLNDAIISYLFNSQLVAAPNGDMNNMRLIAPTECRDNPRVAAYLDKLCADANTPINDVVFVDVRQSMSNGGGPACLRLRVLLNEQQLQAVNSEFLLDHDKISRLEQWVNKHYRDEISPSDLMDPKLMHETRDALDELTQITQTSGIYPFQA